MNAFRFFIRQITENIIIAMPQYTVTAEFIDRSYRLVCCCLHIWAIMTAQDFYFFTQIDSACTEYQIGLTRGWIFLEIICFYSAFFASFLFILISNLCIRETGLTFSEKKDHRLDWLLRYDTLNSLFQTYLLMFSTTLTCALT